MFGWNRFRSAVRFNGEHLWHGFRRGWGRACRLLMFWRASFITPESRPHITGLLKKSTGNDLMVACGKFPEGRLILRSRQIELSYTPSHCKPSLNYAVFLINIPPTKNKKSINCIIFPPRETNLYSVYRRPVRYTCHIYTEALQIKIFPPIETQYQKKKHK